MKEATLDIEGSVPQDDYMQSEDGGLGSKPSSIYFSGMRRRVAQIRALAVRDYIVMRAHKRALLAEIVFPLVMGTLACLFLTVFLNVSSSFNAQLYSTYSCTSDYYTAYGPSNITSNVNFLNIYPSNFVPAACGPWSIPDTWIPYENTTSLLESYTDFVATLPNVNGPSDYRLSTIMYFQNFSTPHNNINVYQNMQVQAYGTVPLGWAVHTLFNGANHVDVNMEISPNMMMFNVKQMFATCAAMMLSMAYLPMASTMAGRLVDEKKAKVREHLRVMGVRSSSYLIAAFAVALLRVMFVSFAMLILLGSFRIVSFTTLMSVWVSLVCYGFALAGFAQIMPAFFGRPTMSNAAVSLFISITGIGAIFASAIPQLIPLLSVLFAPSAFIYSTAQLLNGNFRNLSVSPPQAVGCLIFHMFFYAALSQYLYAINPGEFGVPRPILFPIYDLIAIFKPRSGRHTSSVERQPLLSEDNNKTPTAGHHRNRIVIENLVKVFGNEFDKPAVNNLSLNIREREIFALLGHNGAGKTTTISMLIGMLSSTSYDVAEVLGYDLNDDLDAIRENIGICPQFDVLFDDLSARQHLDLYAAIKGRPVVDADTLLKKLKLPLDSQRACTFSGGMKRRLSVGNALVGDSPLIFLDEPSSGLDPVSRRQLWELLREEKNVKGKTIVLTTHFMEEADYLGDRIAIMSSGRLYCCETSANLKATYGVGYYLNLAKQSTSSSGAAAAHGGNPFNSSLAAEILSRHVDGWTLKQDSVGDVTYLLPSSTLPSFGDLLEEIEGNLANLGCSSYGLAMNSLEDVFVHISEKEIAAAATAAGKKVVDTATLDTAHTASGVPLEELFRSASNTAPVWRSVSQTWTVYVKKWMSFSRSLRLIFTCVIIPMILVGVGFGAAIPNFLNNMMDNNNNGGYNYLTYYDGAEWPDTSNMQIPIYQESDTWGPALNKVLDTFTDMYLQYEREVLGHADVQFSFQRLTKKEYMAGSFLTGNSISFMTTFKPVVQMTFDDTVNTQLTDATYPNVTVGMFYNDQSWAAAYAMSLFAIMYSSIEAVWREANGNTTPVLLPAGVSIQIPISIGNNTPAPTTSTTTTTTTAIPSDEPPAKTKKFLLVATGALVNVCVGQFIAGVMLPLADELNRHIFHTMRLHGLSAAAFWFGTFAFDLTTGCSIVVAYIIGCYARGVTQIQNDILAYQCIILLATVSFSILLVYAIVLLLPENLKPSTYMYAGSGIYYLTLVIPMVAYAALLASGKDSPTWLNVVTPSRVLYTAIIADPDSPSDIWRSDAATGSAISLTVWSLLAIAVVVYKSYFSPRQSFKSAPQTSASSPSTYVQTVVPNGLASGGVDPDVQVEMDRVLTAPNDNMAATMHIRKVFQGVSVVGSASRDQGLLSSAVAGTCDKVAVNDLTFGIQSGECFGLLGPNGAGKTTTVKMMMRELAPSHGSVLFPYAPEATDVDAGPLGSMDSSYRQARLGVCQQGDTLWESFSAEEHMRLYLRIRLGGLYNAAEMKTYIDNAIRKVALEEAGKKAAESYSGGMKRKLSVCIAMYTGARTVFLDEPSTGMDPYARRALWKSIGEALRNDRCVLLTTHSMEEADAVCSRIGIVTGGVMQCIGSGQHLKSRFGSTTCRRSIRCAPSCTTPS